jgi:hypothetical protein
MLTAWGIAKTKNCPAMSSYEELLGRGRRKGGLNMYRAAKKIGVFRVLPYERRCVSTQLPLFVSRT